MLRLCGKSSCFYSGRPVRHAVRILTAPDAATYRVIGQESAEIILGAGETSRTRVRRSHPAEGLNIHYSRQAVPDKLCKTPGADPQAVVLWGGGRKKLPLTRFAIIDRFLFSMLP